ncbi:MULTISPECIES: bifunctional phosphatase PAP2/diacylglycerol kinase family protein [unclassified Pseudofrankia]|uniref:bifunctional phosphatase PAP2/diacylglycerol kinase family protein n=1 Tax=unclassified Pseudofrankia TaxID=2994372 RepID=UPI0008DA5599|nr:MULTISPECIES: bifunctional phosphatase PAP2/diacylglycerol kinase family protein [unclassified Pseudofrankia]MDT3438016.1 phosphatase PAP2 family protein [Pseudofrankia sp. BMG5.37]OHV57278.1 PA-phosphatase [Pseudofrankia sp. BMG5.36]
MASRVGAADRALFGAIAAARPIADPLLPRLSHAADHGLLWWGVAGALGMTRGRRRRAAGRGLVALGLASAVTNGPAKMIFRRGRPVNHAVPLVRRPHRQHLSFSFPSGHSASAAAFATAVALDAPKVAAPVGALAGLVAFSRVYIGVHYPSDVVAGAALGAACALATTKVMPRRSWEPARGRPASASVPALPDGEGLTVVVNASSGTGGWLGQAPDVAGQLRAELPLAKVVEVGPHDDLEEALDEAAASCLVLGVAGGDGTVSAAAARALAHGLPLAVFPVGTLNHFAADLGLATGIADTARAIREGCAVAVDVGRLEGVDAAGERFDGVFLNTASLGGYAHMVAIRERLEKRFGKWPAMVVALAWVLRNDPPIEVDITVFDPTGPTRTRAARRGVKDAPLGVGWPMTASVPAGLERRRLWLLFVGNGNYRPPGFAPTYRSRLDEGLLDLRLVDGASPFSRARLVVAVLTGQLRRSRVYERRTAVRIQVSAVRPAGRWGRAPRRDADATEPAGPLPFARDGEVTDGVQSITITPNGARLIVYRPD